MVTLWKKAMSFVIVEYM